MNNSYFSSLLLFRHIVLFKLADGAPIAGLFNPQKNFSFIFSLTPFLSEIYEAASALKDIPGVTGVEYGENTKVCLAIFPPFLFFFKMQLIYSFFFYLPKDFYEGYPDRSKGFSHSLIVYFKDAASLKEYGPHPIHQKVLYLYFFYFLFSIFHFLFSIHIQNGNLKNLV